MPNYFKLYPYHISRVATQATRAAGLSMKSSAAGVWSYLEVPKLGPSNQSATRTQSSRAAPGNILHSHQLFIDSSRAASMIHSTHQAAERFGTQVSAAFSMSLEYTLRGIYHLLFFWFSRLSDTMDGWMGNLEKQVYIALNLNSNCCIFLGPRVFNSLSWFGGFDIRKYHLAGSMKLHWHLKTSV